MTKAERLFFLLTDVDDALVEEAAIPAYPASGQQRWKRWAALCACLMLVFGLSRVFPLLRMGSSATDGAARPPAEGTTNEAPPEAEPGEAPPQSQESDVLPILSVSGVLPSGGAGVLWTDNAAGFLSDALPPDAADAGILPVYTSTLDTDVSGLPVSTDESAMNALLTDILARFGLTPDACSVTADDLSTDGTEALLGELTAVTPGGAEIVVSYRLTARITLPSSALPEDFPIPDTSDYDALLAFGEAVIQELGWLLDMEDPAPIITGGDVDIFGRTQYTLIIRDGAACDPSASVACSFGFTGGSLSLWLDGRDSCVLLGEYPVITLNEAEELLLTGGWVGYDPAIHAVPQQSQILRAELVYRADLSGQTMPFYRFYLDLGERIALYEAGEPQTLSGDTAALVELYDIPAVESRYLTADPEAYLKAVTGHESSD